MDSHARGSKITCCEYGSKPRAGVEEDPSFKQIIPYLLVRHRGRLFLVQRSTEGGETRLHGKYSIGVGGHINRGDVEGAQDVIAAGLKRELEEELLIRGTWQARPVGVLNDDSNPVGQVHFGLVHVVEVDSPDISVRESDTLAGRLAALQDVRAVRGHMETWSRLILDAADPTTL
ncbi:MAG: NUDIX hydrolase [Bacillati bacterium ANGP1]|uniref:NUDIX hydrolase n=1 Tax=Candidatus Segetimicrobium genomatis TaxID=2569760 RepID=A0A537L1B7_9BACT|nr:MAG: NUDIX hydrolase [Terrabacteria group bacterium ANGP1]